MPMQVGSLRRLSIGIPKISRLIVFMGPLNTEFYCVVLDKAYQKVEELNVDVNTGAKYGTGKVFDHNCTTN